MPDAKAVTRPKPRWPMSVAVLVGLCAAFGGLNRAFTDSGWWFVAMGLATLVTITIVGVRYISRFRWLPPLVGFAVLVVATTFSFAPGLGYLGFIPNGDTIASFGRLIAAGVESIGAQAIPAEPTNGIVFMLTAGAGLLAIGLDFTAQVARRPALVGIPLLVILLIPTFFIGGSGNPLAFVITTGAYLLVLYIDLDEVRAGGALSVGATAVAAALLIPLVLPPITPPEAQGNGNGFAVGINTFITLGDDLRRSNETEVLTYSNEQDDPQYLAVSVIKDFSGTKWSPEEPRVREFNFLIDFPGAPGVEDGVSVIERTTEVDIVNMGGHWVPAPYAPTSISGLEGNWSYASETFSVTSPNLSVRGEQYTVESLQVNPSEEQLRNAPGVPLGDMEDYLRLPDGLPEIVTDSAVEVVGDATNAFDQAVALQNYFTSGEFEYSEVAPVEQGYDGTSAAVVARFLEAKSGYCVHYSAAMAVMARAIGIPARIVIGFTPGEYRRETDDKPAHYSVTTANLHAWPELWFEGIGWVRFEPTPGRGIAPSFNEEDSANPSNAPTSAPSSAPTVGPSATPSPTTTAREDEQALGPSNGPDQTVPRIVVALVVLAALIVVLLPFVPMVVRGWRRMRRYWRVRRTGSAVDAWAELRDTATDLGWAAATLTPREFAIAVRKGKPEPVVRALANLLTALEATAYSPTPADSLARDLTIVRRALLRGSKRRDRLSAFVTPASVQLRFLRRRTLSAVRR